MHVKSIGAFEHQTWNPLCEDENGCKVHAARSWSGRTEKGAAARRVCVFFLTFFQAEPGRYQKSMIRRSNCILRWLSLADNELGHPCGSLAAAFDSTLHLCVCVARWILQFIKSKVLSIGGNGAESVFSHVSHVQED